MSDVELDFVLTRSVTELSGRVVDKSGAGIGRTTVVVLADDPQRWGRATRFVRTTSSNPDGSFTIRGLPAATYVALAVNGFEPGDEQDPEILETFRTGGTRVALADGERKTVSLRVAD